MNTRFDLRRPLLCFALPVVLACSAPRAAAQSISIGIGKHGHHGGVNVTAGFTFGIPRCAPPVHCAPPVYCAPPPVYCAPPPTWIPGHYENVERRIYVQGCVHNEYVPAAYEERVYRDYSGRTHVERVQVRPATWRPVQDPGHWECVTERVWVEGGWRKYAS